MRTSTGLLDAARTGDAAAREELVTRHLDTVRAVCGSRLRSPHDVADATQETFVRALARLDQVRDADRLDAWLRAIAVRVCADQGRHLQRALVVADPVGETATDDPGPAELLLAGEEASRLHATLATLGERDRQALWLRDAVGLPVAHVAADLGVTEGSARVLLARARDRLRTAYEGAAAVAVVGLLRIRGRLADLTGVDARVALAAQLAIVAVAVAVAPGIDGPGGTTPVPAPGSAAGSVAVAPVASVRADARPQDEHVPGVPSHAAPARPDHVAAPGAGDRPPAPVELGTTPPAGDSRFGVATSDGEGEVAGVEAWGGPVSELLGSDEGEADDGSDPGTDDGDDEHGSSGLQVGPVEVLPGDAGR